MTAAVAPAALHPPSGTVGAAMITDVKLSPADVTVAELRSFFADDHVHAAVVVEAGVLLAVVDRADLVGRPGGALAADVGSLVGRIVGPDAGLASARRLLLVSGRRRLAVVDADGMLLGLLCLKRTRSGFCSDRDARDRSCGDNRHHAQLVHPTSCAVQQLR